MPDLVSHGVFLTPVTVKPPFLSLKWMNEWILAPSASCRSVFAVSRTQTVLLLLLWQLHFISSVEPLVLIFPKQCSFYKSAENKNKSFAAAATTINPLGNPRSCDVLRFYLSYNRVQSYLFYEEKVAAPRHCPVISLLKYDSKNHISCERRLLFSG